MKTPKIWPITRGVEGVPRPETGLVALCMFVKGKRPISHLVAKLSDIDGVREVGMVNEETALD